MNTKLVKKIMRQLGIRGLPGPRKGIKNLKNAPTCEDLVQRQFTTTAPNQLWLTDITEHPTREGKLYCCVVLDLYSRKVISWAIDRRCEAALVNDALAKAGANRQTSASTIIHSDSEYVRAGVPGLPDPHSDGRDRMLVPGSSRAS